MKISTVILVGAAAAVAFVVIKRPAFAQPVVDRVQTTFANVADAVTGKSKPTAQQSPPIVVVPEQAVDSGLDDAALGTTWDDSAPATGYGGKPYVATWASWQLQHAPRVNAA